VAKRARHDLPAVQERRAEVVRLRAEGKTWDEIARLTGFANGSSASKAWKTAIQQRPDLTVDEIRRNERERLEHMDSVLAAITTNVPVKTTSIGRTQWDPRTCSCPTRARTDRDHDPDCTVEPVLDVGQVTAAVRARLALGESYRRLVGADAQIPRTDTFTEDAVRLMAEVVVARRDRALTALPPAPPHYATMTPQEQMEADLARHRAQLGTAPLDIVEAEIIDD
jgi:hypothetical protein